MAARTLGVILAGGRSARFGGGDKALACLNGKPLIAWVAAGLASQVDAVAINAGGAAYAKLGLPIIGDDGRGGEGPLAGVLAALAHARRHGFVDVATVPCDAPTLRADLVRRLRIARGDAACAFAEIAGSVNAVFALYRVDAEPAIATAFARGMRAPRDLATIMPSARAAFSSAEARDFRDIDTRAELAMREAELGVRR